MDVVFLWFLFIKSIKKPRIIRGINKRKREIEIYDETVSYKKLIKLIRIINPLTTI